MAANEGAYARTTFRPRVLRDVGAVDPATTLLGRPLPLPLVLAPTGFTRIADPDGELAVARAAARAGLPYTLSTLSTRSIEEVAAVGPGRRWFQVYVWRDRGLVREMIERAAGAGYEALVLTVDTAVLGRRERDVRRGFTLPPKIGPGTLLDGALHPGWTWAFVRSEPIRFANVAEPVPVPDRATGVRRCRWPSTSTASSTRPSRGTTWRGCARCGTARSCSRASRPSTTPGWPPTRASRPSPCPTTAGASSTAPPPRSAWSPRWPTPWASRVEIICDGGVRRGSDIVKAVALGARAAMAGRAYLYGLGAAGERGVDHVLGLLDADVRRTMALVGARTVADLCPALVSGPGP